MTWLIVVQLLLLQMNFLSGQRNGTALTEGNPTNSFRGSSSPLKAQEPQSHNVTFAQSRPPLHKIEEATKQVAAEGARGIFTPCRSLSPPENETLFPVLVKGNDYLDLELTLTSVICEFIPGLEFVGPAIHVFKKLASFFKGQTSTTVEADYWELLKNQVEYMIESSIDESILSATNNAISRMQEDMDLFLENSQPTKTWSTLAIALTMDATLNDILSDYYGVTHTEKSLLHYMDMATTRIVLWQTTAIRYIAELGLYGQGSSSSVCDIVLKWRNAYEFETERIKKDIMPAMDTWRKKWKSKMQLSCRVKCDDYFGWGWNKYIDCYVKDGYNGHNYPTSHHSCDHHTCWTHVCDQFCSKMVSEQQAKADATYRDIMTVPDTFMKNMEQVPSSKMFDYVRGCSVGPTPPDVVAPPISPENPDSGNSGHKVSNSQGVLLVSLLAALAFGLRLPLLQ
ncbi:uncharacterized protein LOC143027697 [Oratosquilla oratoria]|uniref:uncharacterized protein LOC143027697 n=1 Tax=Oratosquilla oratoria TaxID=337810 RepID=UPI003F777B65